MLGHTHTYPLQLYLIMELPLHLLGAVPEVLYLPYYGTPFETPWCSSWGSLPTLLWNSLCISLVQFLRFFAYLIMELPLHLLGAVLEVLCLPYYGTPFASPWCSSWGFLPTLLWNSLCISLVQFLRFFTYLIMELPLHLLGAVLEVLYLPYYGTPFASPWCSSWGSSLSRS